MTITTAADIPVKRDALKTAVFGPAGISGYSGMFDGNAHGGAPSGLYLKPIASTYWLSFNMGKTNANEDIISRTHTTTFAGSTKLLIINGGHGQAFFPAAVAAETRPGMAAISQETQWMAEALSGGCDVILSSMPFNGENAFTTSYCPSMPFAQSNTSVHEWLGLQTTNIASGSPLKYFLIPPLSALNTAIESRANAGLPPYEKISVMGYSGGGWATTAMAAIDPRITQAFSVAGSLPMEYRGWHRPDGGDWEQRSMPASYYDLYAMSIGEVGRKAWLIHNEFDPCCFRTASVLPWAKPFLDRVAVLPGEISIVSETGAAAHTINHATRLLIMDAVNN